MSPIFYLGARFCQMKSREKKFQKFIKSFPFFKIKSPCLKPRTEQGRSNMMMFKLYVLCIYLRKGVRARGKLLECFGGVPELLVLVGQVHR